MGIECDRREAKYELAPDKTASYAIGEVSAEPTDYASEDNDT